MDTPDNKSQWYYQSHSSWLRFDAGPSNFLEGNFCKKNSEHNENEDSSNSLSLQHFEVDFDTMKCRKFGAGDWNSIFRGNTPPENSSALKFYAIGDWGYSSPSLQSLAKAMDSRSHDHAPAFILALGDNFYPSGVQSVSDPHFKTTWEDVFLKYNSMRVPWQATLGNHDYDGNPQAQIEFTEHSSNPSGLWRMPGKSYMFSHVTPTGTKVDFFGIDTNGAQYSVRGRFPHAPEELFQHKKWLSEALKSSTASWKIVFAHHPLYTKSCKHGVIGRCLRGATYTFSKGVGKGFGLEDVLVEGHVDAYFSGHEHVFQHHFSRGIHHFVCGASGIPHIGFYGGEDKSTEITWYDKSLSKAGFVSVSITDIEMEVLFNEVNEGEVYRVKINKEKN